MGLFLDLGVNCTLRCPSLPARVCVVCYTEASKRGLDERHWVVSCIKVIGARRCSCKLPVYEFLVGVIEPMSDKIRPQLLLLLLLLLLLF